MTRRLRTSRLALVWPLLFPTGSFLAETVHEVTPCALQADPDAYDHRLVEVTGFVERGLEDFSIVDPTCVAGTSIWLEYGGTVGSGTIFCCGITAERARSEPLTVEQVGIPLLKDSTFDTFDELIQRQENIVVRATLVGRFFAGREGDGLGTNWRGYGHFGCCSLLAIQQVRAVDRTDRQDLDYDLEADTPDINQVGCGYRPLDNSFRMDRGIAAQHEAENRQPWAFDDPERVASEALAHSTGAAFSVALKEKRRTQGRIVYVSASPVNSSAYMVVVSRPYLVTCYAQDPNRIAWIAAAVWESWCEIE